jgi:hypothetical protein
VGGGVSRDHPNPLVDNSDEDMAMCVECGALVEEWEMTDTPRGETCGDCIDALRRWGDL